MRQPLPADVHALSCYFARSCSGPAGAILHALLLYGSRPARALPLLLLELAAPSARTPISTPHPPHPTPTPPPPLFRSSHRLAAELGSVGAKGPGSLRVGLLDNLWTMTEQQVLEGAKVHE